MKLDEDVNWKFVDIPFLRDSGKIVLSGEFEIPKRAVNYPRNAYSALSSTAEQVGGIVSRPSEDKIKVLPKLSEEFYVLRYDGEGDLYKIEIHKPTVGNVAIQEKGKSEVIGELTMDDLEERREVSNEIQDNIEFRGVFDDKWEKGDPTSELLDILYPRNQQTDNGTYIEIDYESKRSGETKTRKGEVLDIEDGGKYTIVTVNREDGARHQMFIEDGEVHLYTMKSEETVKLGVVEQVLTHPVYHTPDYAKD